MSEQTTLYPLSAVRAVALRTQRLDVPNGAEPTPTPDVIYNMVAHLGCVQIDTLHMVRRSHYLVLWSRLGRYDPADFERLIYAPGERRLFEYWKHAMSIIPLADYRYHMPTMAAFRRSPGRWWEIWLERPESQRVLEHVRKRLREEGPLRVADFKHERSERGGWWDWKPAKGALEYLFARGEVMVADRVNFQRVYDLRERVLPEWVDTNEASPEEADRHRIEQAVRALGICQPMQAAEYAYMKRNSARPIVEGLIREGVFVEVQAELLDGETHTLIIHRENLPLLRQAADGTLTPQRTTFLSPFDSLFWARGRDEQFWGFRNVLEAYKRAGDRIWGYFCLPILHRDRLVGRFDPRLERKAGRLVLRALYLEPGVEPDEALVAGVAGAMRDFLAFHEAREVAIERSDPVEFGEKLLEAL